MKTANWMTKMWASLLALGFALFLVYNTLTSSDFPRGLYRPPAEAYWDSIALLNPNRVWNYYWEGNDNLQAYLDSAAAHGIKCMLRLVDGSYPHRFEMEYYSSGLHQIYEAEWNYAYASTHLPEFYYFWWHRDALDTNETEDRGAIDLSFPSDPPEAASWKCDYPNDSAGIMLHGPAETYGTLAGPDPYTRIYGEQTSWPGTDSTARSFKTLIKVSAAAQNLNAADTVFGLLMYRDDTTLVFARYYTKDSLGGVFYDSLKTFEVDYSLPGNTGFTYYRVDWRGHCDFWVDYLEFMDVDRAKYLFYRNQQGNWAWRDSVWNLIAVQCSTIEQTYQACGDTLAGWKQSDEPIRASFTAHRVVNDSARVHLQFPPVTPFKQMWDIRRPEVFAFYARPQILDTDIYPYQLPDTTGTHYLGSQVELDSLAVKLERAWQATSLDSIPLHFTGQVHGGGDSDYRHPERSEILAETFMALAHGATGISFFPYRTAATGYQGLVNSNYQHPSGTNYDEKWQAVHDVFAQLNSIGDTLLLLDRDAAYCVAQSPNYQSPITSIYFEEGAPNYIEVGQFHLSSDPNQKYLIVVNRKTDADRHITVVGNFNGTNALRDIYTQERFISSTDSFCAIPFDSGQGRVFKIESFSTSVWDNDLKIVLADTVTNTWDQIPNVIQINPGPREGNTTIWATARGCLKFTAGKVLDCNGAANDSVVFTALQPEQKWHGLYFNDSGNSESKDTLYYTAVQCVEGVAIKPRNHSKIYIARSNISLSEAGIVCDNSELILQNSWVTNCDEFGVYLSNCDARIYADSIMYIGNLGAALWLDMGSVPKIGDCRISHNTLGSVCADHGTVPIMLRNETSYPSCGYNHFEDNFGGIAVGVDAAPQLGFNDRNKGQNTFLGNGYTNMGCDIYNDTPDTVFARYNYWGHDPQDSQFVGLVDSLHWLDQEPDFFGGGSSFVKNDPGGVCGGDPGGPGGPGSNILAEAYRLNDVAVGLFLDGEYYAAIDTFALVLDAFPGTSPARFALDHIVVCYREAEDYEGAVAYLNGFVQSPPDPSLISLALYHKVLNLARLQEYPAAIAIAGNMQVIQGWQAELLEPTLIELGMMLKYGLQNVVSGDSVFQQFLNQHPQSDLAPIAAMELGLPWEGSGIYGSKASGAAVVADLPEEFRLYQNHPNPFNPFTTIAFGLPVASWVKVEVFDICGRIVGARHASPQQGWYPAGVHEITFDGSDLASGIYIVRLNAGNFSAVQKMVLLK